MTDKTVDDIKVGTVIYGYAGGYFGRDSYEDRTVIHKGFYNGKHYIVLSSYKHGKTRFYMLVGSEIDTMVDYLEPEVNEWD